MVFEAARLRFHITAHSREDEHQSKYSFQKRLSQYERRQQGHPTPKGRAMIKKNDS